MLRRRFPILALCLIVVSLGGVYGKWTFFGVNEEQSKPSLGRVQEFEKDITVEEGTGTGAAGAAGALQGVTVDPLATVSSQSVDTAAVEASSSAPVDKHWSKSRFIVEPFSINGPLKWECLPKRVQDLYTLNGKIPYVPFYFDEGFGAAFVNTGPFWSEEHINSFVVVADTRNASAPLCPYGEEANRAFFGAFTDHPVEGKSVLVIGSQTPWAEAILISFGAARVTTVDFNKPTTNHPKLTTMSIAELDATDETFDALVSYSSLEHDGLGRYGDPLNPNGDLLRMQKLKTLVKKDGKLYLGVPMSKDSLQFNAHRLYGEIRWPMLINGWDVKGSYGYCKIEECFQIDNSWGTQPVVVLTLKE